MATNTQSEDRILELKRTVKLHLRDASAYVRDLFLNSIGGAYLCPRWLRRIIYTACGNTIQSPRISSRCFIGGSKLSVGKGTFISYENFFDLTDRITVGNDVNIAMRCSFVTSSHEIGGTDRRAGQIKSAPITIGDGCWIGANVTILPGVTVGRGTIIAAGAVVTKDCDADSLYAGVPAKKVRTLDAAGESMEA